MCVILIEMYSVGAAGESVVKSRRGTWFAPAQAPTSAQAAAQPAQFAEESRTTVVLRGLPGNCAREMLMAAIEAEDFGRFCDFLHLPYNFKRTRVFGYAILNLTTASRAQRAIERFSGLTVSEKRVACDWSTSIQGLEALVKKYRNSSVMHPMVPSVYRPMCFSDGVSIPFPEPTEVLKQPASSELLLSLARATDVANDARTDVHTVSYCFPGFPGALPGSPGPLGSVLRRFEKVGESWRRLEKVGEGV